MTNEQIHILLPVAMKEVFNAIAPAFTAETGHDFEVSIMLNPEVPGHIATGAKWSVALSNPCYIDEIVGAGLCDGSRWTLGYSPLAIAMRGKPTAPPLTEAKGIADLLLHAETIAVTTGGTSTSQFARLTNELSLSHQLDGKLRSLPGGRPAAELAQGTVEAAVLPLTNVVSVPGIFAKAICRYDMGVQVDIALCLASGANGVSHRFAEWLCDPKLRDRLFDLGLRPQADT